MSNSYFRFKQFTIHQDRCAMKVSTDACIQGAWTPVVADSRVLDIGAGTGLLSLMLAQKDRTINIDAIEMDSEAAAQAKENVDASPWSDRAEVVHADAAQYAYQHRYNLIISNPPFFNNSLLGNSHQRNSARHTITLSYQGLFDIISANLAEDGVASVLLPYSSLPQWQDILAKHSWQVVKQLTVYPGVGHSLPNRAVVLCKKGLEEVAGQETLHIRNTEGLYTDEFSQLMHPYYLDR